MTVRQALAATTARLIAAGIPTPSVDAELLVCHALGYPRAQLRLETGTMLSAEAASALESAVQRREFREPLQLILGSVGFRYLELDVRPGVFIPRPETEVLAGEAITRIPPGGVVVEPCTGTGAIACAVATESAAATVVATDLSPAAVALARDNAVRTGAAVTVVACHLLAGVDPRLRGAVDVLVSNPPYLTPADLTATEPEVADWDPLPALVAGPTGHEVSDQLLAEAGQWLRPGGWVLLEVDAARAGETARRASAAGLENAAVLPDLTGADRFVVARRSGADHEARS